MVHFENPSDLLPSLDPPAAVPCDLRTPFRAQGEREIVVQHIAGESGFAGPRYPGDDDQPAERYAHIFAPQVVQRRVFHDERVRVARNRPAMRHRMPQRLREQASGHRRRRALQVAHGARCDDMPSARAGAGPEVHDVIGAPDRLLIVLDDEQRIAFRL